MGSVRGMVVPVVTPLRVDYEVDAPALRCLCGRLVEAGVDALFMLGTTGEFYGLNPRQRSLVVDIALEVAEGRVPVVAGISERSGRISHKAGNRR